MANAKSQIKKVARPIEYDEVEMVTLELTREEALFLSAITSKIGGNPDNSLRSLSDSIRNALESVVGRQHFADSAWRGEEPAGFFFANNTNAEEDTTTSAW
jgi:hypothetical protein